MAITAKDVQTLREMTGVGMMDCKKALTEAEGNMDKAVEILREKGLAASQKKAGRIAAGAFGLVSPVPQDQPHLQAVSALLLSAGVLTEAYRLYAHQPVSEGGLAEAGQAVPAGAVYGQIRHRNL